jgi:hypothetical protein
MSSWQSFSAIPRDISSLSHNVRLGTAALSVSGPPNFSHFMIDYTNREVVSDALTPTKINCIDRL